MTNILQEHVQTTHEPQKSVNTQDSVAYEIRDSVSDQLLEYVSIGHIAEVQNKVSKTFSGTTNPPPSGVANKKSTILRQKIEKVQTFSKEQLIQGIKKELNKNITHLKKEALRIQYSQKHFSAFDLNNTLARIRHLREEIHTLIQFGLEKLRELYISLVLKLKLVVIQ